jgi:uncharacterized metal-binding protein YceD (DUF177 family)
LVRQFVRQLPEPTHEHPKRCRRGVAQRLRVRTKVVIAVKVKAEQVDFERAGLKGQMQLICQRCMQPCLVQIDESRQFVFLANEALADAFPMEDDALEPLVMSSQFDLLGTIEDEILLSLPLIPKHPEGECEPAALASTADDLQNQGETLKKPDNPFNILKNMKKKE